MPCGSPALRDARFCYHHVEGHARSARARRMREFLARREQERRRKALALRILGTSPMVRRSCEGKFGNSFFSAILRREVQKILTLCDSENGA